MTRKKKLRVFTASFSGHWLGGDAVIVADSKEEAAVILEQELANQGLFPKVDPAKLHEMDLYTSAAHVLFDGNY